MFIRFSVVMLTAWQVFNAGVDSLLEKLRKKLDQKAAHELYQRTHWPEQAQANAGEKKDVNEVPTEPEPSTTQLFFAAFRQFPELLGHWDDVAHMFRCCCYTICNCGRHYF